MRHPNERCGCEDGRDCTKTTVCAIQTAVDDATDEYQQREDEIIVALGSQGILPSGIVGRVKALRAEIEQLRKALRDAINAAWDGPPEPVGTGCKEKYSEWRRRLEKECKAVLHAPTKGTESECPECKGRGFTRFNAYGSGESQATADFPCENCNETGYVSEQDRCVHCEKPLSEHQGRKCVMPFDEAAIAAGFDPND